MSTLHRVSPLSLSRIMEVSMATVLIVEDSDFQRSLIGSIARDSGHDVVAATNGREGLVAALEHEPDCIITDILMPEMDGLDMIDAMRARGQRAHVIVVSADIQDTTRERARALGVAAFLSKPVEAKADLSPPGVP